MFASVFNLEHALLLTPSAVRVHCITLAALGLIGIHLPLPSGAEITGVPQDAQLSQAVSRKHPQGL